MIACFPLFYMFYVTIILNDEYINKYSNHMIGYPLIILILQNIILTL